MNDLAIRVDGLSKKYHIGGKQERYRTLRETLTDAVAAPFRRVGRLLRGHATGASELNETIWALKDVSFEVKRGEVIGVIGRNGAGKSTLLKILSRITEPTEGYADVYGRVGSLLEVGTGFHPELTGRENIFLNGAILGMKKAEIDQKFDEIVAFAEVEKFIDTPVKHYSTGMYLRLAFAVAAHLEPEILLVDEVLAVGDAQFQKKCLGKMGEVANEGRTVLFVSHNMSAVRSLCNSSILLREGRLKFEGDTKQAIQIYDDEGAEDRRNIPISQRSKNHGIRSTLRARIVDFKIISEGQENPPVLNSSKPFIAKFAIETGYDIVRCGIQFLISDDIQNLILFDSASVHGIIYELRKGINHVECHVEPVFLCAGDYRISCVLSLPNQGLIDYVPDAYAFTVNELDPNNTGFNLQRRSNFAVYYVSHKWGKLNQ